MNPRESDGPAPHDLVAELNHQINSPLAAIRNALYLAACRTSDPVLQHYLQLADQEVDFIADTLRSARRQPVRQPCRLLRAAA